MVSCSPLAPTAETSTQRNVVRLHPADAPFTNADEYLRAVHPEDLPQTIRDCLNNDAEMTYYIAHDLRTAEVRRPLEFKLGLDAGNFREFSTLRPWYNIHAAFVFITGELNDPPCQFKAKGVIRDAPCTTIFARCVIPRADLDYTSGAKFNATACASHQYQCEGSKCVRGGVAQTKSQFAFVQAQPIIAQTQPTAASSTSSQLQPVQALVQVPTAQPDGPQHGSALTLHNDYTHNQHVAHTLSASTQDMPTQVQPFQSQSIEADPAQGYDLQDHGYEGYSDAHHRHTATSHGPGDENYLVPPSYSGQLISADMDDHSQTLQLAAYTQDASSQNLTHHAPTAQDDPSCAYRNLPYSAQEHFVSPHLCLDPHSAQQIKEAGMEHAADQGLMDDLIFDDSAADTFHDTPHVESVQSYDSHEEFYDNNNVQM